MLRAGLQLFESLAGGLQEGLIRDLRPLGHLPAGPWIKIHHPMKLAQIYGNKTAPSCSDTPGFFCPIQHYMLFFGVATNSFFGTHHDHHALPGAPTPA